MNAASGSDRSVPTDPAIRKGSGYLVRVGLLAAIYVLFARLGLQIHAINSFATLVWPPTGISLAAILIFGYRFWPGIAAGAVIANLWTGAPLLAALGIGCGNTMEALVGAYALRRIPGFRTSLDRVQDVLGLVILGAALSSMVSATIGVLSLFLSGVVSSDRFAVTWRAWWLGDAIGTLVVAPLLLTLGRAPEARGGRKRLAEAASLALLLLLASLFVFEVTRNASASLLAPLFVWTALRFEQRGSARATFLVSVVAVWGTARGHGAFATATVEEGLFLLQAFMAVTAATFLVLGAVVSEKRSAESELRRAKEAAEAASRAKDNFLAALSHELRTPLTPVLALSSALERNRKLPPEARRRIETIRRNAEFEARLIDDLLDLTRIAKGKLKLEPEPVDLAMVLDQIVEICRGEAAAKGLLLEQERVETGMMVLGDPARLRQVFWNILQNAIKFSDWGGRIFLRASLSAPGRVAVEISDTGAGIEPSEIGRIFRPFEQAGEGRGGLGLGLAISNTIVEAHGGTLTAASGGHGSGSMFRVELARLSDAESVRPRERVSLEKRSITAPCRVLLVEDHADTLRAATDLLEELSCQVVGVASVEDALLAAEGHTFDIVVSDLGLPDGSGLDLMRTLRDRHALTGIALSGYGMDEDLRRSREAGFVEHLVKPITIERLEAAIERFFADRSPG